ncbi:MAG: hypothetical protein V3S10_01130 [Dehalococcoidales bacterium]
MAADVALFPEMWSHGYSFPDASDVFLVRFREFAGEPRPMFRHAPAKPAQY